MSTSSPERIAIERAIAIVTAFCTAVETETFDEHAAEALYDILDDLERPIYCAKTDEEREHAHEGLTKTVIALAAMMNSLLGFYSSEIDKFTLLSGIAETLYGSMS